jgi:predicted glycosyltransferase
MGNIPSFICAKKILVPEFLNIQKVKKQGAGAKKIIQYPGVKEGIYLWQKYLASGITKFNENKNIYIRPEPRTAQYYKGGENFLDGIITELKNKYSLVILTRDKEQFEHYKTSPFQGVDVPDKPISFDTIAENCQLFIGAGGTMTREMAVIGVPTISVYQDELLDVDKYLIKEKMMQHLPSPKTQQILDFLEKSQVKEPNKNLLIKGKESYYLIKKLLEENF